MKVYEDELQNFLNSMEDLPRDRVALDLVDISGRIHVHLGS